MVLAELRPVAPAPIPHTSFGIWLLAAVVLAVIVASGVVFTSRR